MKYTSANDLSKSDESKCYKIGILSTIVDDIVRNNGYSLEIEITDRVDSVPAGLFTSGQRGQIEYKVKYIELERETDE